MLVRDDLKRVDKQLSDTLTPISTQPTGAETSQDIQRMFEPYSPVDTNMFERLIYWSLAQPDDLAFRFLQDGESDEVSLTYSQLDQRAKAIGAELVSRGVKRQPVLLLFPPGLEFVEAFFGCHYAGAIPVPAYPPRRNRNMGRINAISEDCQAVLALSTREVISRNEGMLDDSPSLQRMPWLAVEDVAQELASDWIKPKASGSDVGLIQYTSGSTGTPKGVVLTHDNLIANCRMITLLFGVSRDACGVSWLPLYHDMGLIGGILQPLYFGRPMTLMSPVSFLTRPARWLKAISKYQVSVSGGPNFAYQLCADKITDEEIAGLDLSSWKIAFNGAEPIRYETLKKFTDRFAACGFRHESHYPCYGMAETTLIVTGSQKGVAPVVSAFDRSALDDQRVVSASAEHPQARRLVSSGRALAGSDIKIVSPESRQILHENEIGEIWVSTPGVGTGYWNKPVETEETFHANIGDGQKNFLRTGDLGFLQNGELYVTGRLKDLIIIRGVNKYPQDLESTVENCSSRLRTAGAAAFSVDRDGEEKLVVVCEVERGGNKVWGDELQAIRSSVAAEHDLPPDAVILVRANSVPKTSSGKVQRKLCRQQFLDEKLLVVAKWVSWEANQAIESETSVRETNGRPLSADEAKVAPLVIDAVKQIAKERAKSVDLDTNIVVDLGLDSLERLQIAYTIEETFGGRIPDDVLQEIETVREITEAIVAHVGSEPLANLNASPNREQPRAARDPDFEIPPSYYEIDKMPEFIRVQQLKGMLQSTGIRNPFFSVHQGTIADTTQIDGRELISFASYNYLGFSGEPDINEAAKAAIDQFGTSVSASRLVSGEKTIHRQFEQELAEFLSVDDIISFPAGHAMNETVIGHVVGPGDLIIHDSLAHNCIIKGAELSGARRRAFDHNDWKLLDEVLQEIRHEYRRVLIALEGLYSMDGDFPDLPKFVEIKKKHKAWIFIDEAHSIGTLGPTGRGLGEHYGIDRSDIEFWMGTLSKSFGSCGGFIGGNQALIEYLRYTTPGFVFAAGINPPSVGAALASLRKLKSMPERVAQLQENSKVFLELAKQAGLNTGPSHDSPIIPVITGDSMRALRLSEALFGDGINAQPILHPAVAESEARVRFFITAKHKRSQIEQTVAAVQSHLKKI